MYNLFLSYIGRKQYYFHSVLHRQVIMMQDVKSQCGDMVANAITSDDQAFRYRNLMFGRVLACMTYEHTNDVSLSVTKRVIFIAKRF